MHSEGTIQQAISTPQFGQAIKKTANCVHEARILARCRSHGVLAPAVYFVDDTTQTIYMEYVDGKTVKECGTSLTVEKQTSKVEKKQNIAHKIGTILAKIHNHSMVHGDPTTSNLLVREKDGEIVMIDFGLGSQNASIDDKAVDLYVLERAMLATHPNSEELFLRFCRLTKKNQGRPKRYFQSSKVFAQEVERGWLSVRWC